MNERSSLKKTFLSLMEDSDTDVSAKDIVYKDMTRKLCNIRIQEYLSSQKQRFASEKGQALLTLHTNLQSHIKME